MSGTLTSAGVVSVTRGCANTTCSANYLNEYCQDTTALTVSDQHYFLHGTPIIIDYSTLLPILLKVGKDHNSSMYNDCHVEANYYIVNSMKTATRIFLIGVYSDWKRCLLKLLTVTIESGIII